VRAIAAKRRILLISDGQTSPDDEQRLRSTIAGAGVEVSAVAIGSNTNRSLLQELANSTGGRAYFPGDLAELPKIVAREAARSRSGAVVEEPFVPRSASHPVMSGIDPRSLPMLSGYVVGAAKASAVNVLASHLDDPILSAWQFGLGRVAVFTADLRSSWSAPLRAWGGFGRLWAQQVRWVSRGLDDSQLRVTSARDHEGLRFDLDAEREDGRPIELIGMRATLRSPDDKSAAVTFVSTGPGRYVAHVNASLTSFSGPYALSLSARDGDGGAEHHVVTGLFHGDDQERASVGADDGLLGRLAAITGGRVLSPSDNPFAGSRAKSYQDVSTVVAAVALMLYLVDVLFGARLISFAASTSRFPGRFRPLARY
jgi:nitrogen fixation protein FixH